MRHWRKILPLLVSFGLIGWLLYRVSPGALLASASQLPWKQLTAATIAMALSLYLWDGVCLGAVYARDGVRLGYWRMLHIRGLSYLVGAVHSQLGLALVVWNVARYQAGSLIGTASRGVLLLYHDALVLVTAGLSGASFSGNPHAPGIRVFCGTALCLLISMAVAVALMPIAARQRFQRTRWGSWLGVWTWRHSLRLLFLRLIYYAIVGTYAALALRICRVHLDHATVLSTIPLVLLAVSLPSISGLGTRETALYLLLGAEHRESLVAMGLFWSTGLIVVRLTIGMVHLWFSGEMLVRPPASAAPHAPFPTAAGDQAAADNRAAPASDR
jgi:hypothetical protein